jgi:ribosomal 50S subunit-associated protein YjgA (DUF615 family)
MAKRVTLEYVEASIARWQTRLRRAVRAVEKLEKQRKRLVKAQTDLAIAPATATRPKPKPEPLAVTIMRELAEPAPALDTAIPSFLRRAPDPVAAQLKAGIAETKRLKAKGRIAKMKAKQSGETKRMPLTGKAALEAIRNG